MSESRFTRRSGAAHSAPSDSDGNLQETFTALQARATELRERRVRLTVQQEQVQREIAHCQTEAKALGINSLEELEALVTKLEAEEQERLQTFERELNEEEARLTQVEEDLARLDGRSGEL
jgi:predicted  nucleic acid-binding Zn-ribbon protein